MTVRANLRDIAQQAQTDPKQALLDSVGERIDGIEVFHNLVLVATYIEPEKTPGGIIKPDRTLAENRFQGKAGLVLKMGPLAFLDDSVAKFGGRKPNLLDWVFVYPSDGREFFMVNITSGSSLGTSCRLFEDVHIKARLSDPGLVY